MGQYKTNFRDTLRFFSSDKRTQRVISQENSERKEMIYYYLFIYLFLRWSSSRRLNLYLCFCFTLNHDTNASQKHRWAEIQIAEKSSAFRTKKEKARGERKLLVPSNSHRFLDTFCCLYIFKNIMQSAAMSRHNRMFSLCRLKTISSALATHKTEGQCSENVLFKSLKTSYH